ncbi:MAG: oligosaccharide flippase family protein [Lachnospiraceae bacterium]|nr:oligosaccharide flippase family protein [Lachnospiraceae bacterium]
MSHNKLIEKYRKIPAPAKASLWFTLCNVIQKGISFLTMPIFTRIMTTAEYGEYTNYQAWYQIVSVFATLNLYYGVFNNGMTKYPDDKERFTSSMTGLTTVLTVGLFVVYLIAPSFWNDVMGLSSLYVYAMFIELLFVPAFNFWAAKERYDYKYRKIVVVTMIIAFGSPILGVLAVMNTTYKAEARVLAYVFVQVCIGLVFYIYNMVKGKKFFIGDYWRFALLFNIPLIPHYLSSQILNQADRIMIGKMIGKSEQAIYSVAYGIGTLMQIVITAINNSFTPYMYKSIKTREFSGIRKNSKITLTMVGFACIGVMLLGPEIIRVMASESFQDAVWIIPPVACAIFFKYLYPLFSTVEFYYEKTGFVMIASCIGAVANVILNYIFIGIYGYFAAGYTTLFCYILYSFAHYLFQRRVAREHEITEPMFDMGYIAAFSVFMLAAMTATLFLYPHRIVRYVVCLAAAAGFVIMFMRNKSLFIKKG